jgi:DNA modification methylase
MLELDKIHCGDNCDLLGQLPRECIDLVVTSPPYDDLRTYGGHSWDFYGVAWQLKRVLKPGGVIVWVVADATKDGSETGTSMEQALHFKRLGLNLHDTMIYQKLNYLPQNAPDRYDQAWEYVFVLSAGRPKSAQLLTKKNAKGGVSLWTGGRINQDGVLHDKVFREIAEDGMRNNVWPYPTGGGTRDHPAVFPLALATDCVATWSNPGDIVLDPFSGSGTTAKAAKELGRRFLGLEINPEYCAIAERRIAQQVLELEAV